MVRGAHPTRTQYASAEITSPWARDPRAQSVCWLTLSLRNRTEPSHIRTLTPPGWLLARFIIPAPSMAPPGLVPQLEIFGFGGSSVVPIVRANPPIAQLIPR